MHRPAWTYERLAELNLRRTGRPDLASDSICRVISELFDPNDFDGHNDDCADVVAMRGDNEYPALIRKTDPKAIRIFLEDGSSDAWNPLFGSWYDANLGKFSR